MPMEGADCAGADISAIMITDTAHNAPEFSPRRASTSATFD